MSLLGKDREALIPFEEAMRKMHNKKMFVKVPVGDTYVELEVTGVYAFSLYRGEMVLAVKS